MPKHELNQLSVYLSNYRAPSVSSNNNINRVIFIPLTTFSTDWRKMCSLGTLTIFSLQEDTGDPLRKRVEAKSESRQSAKLISW